MAGADVIDASETDWDEMRNRVAFRFLNVSADDFARKFKAGEYGNGCAPGLMAVLALFPELD